MAHADITIGASSLTRTLQGVEAATKGPRHAVEPVLQWLRSPPCPETAAAAGLSGQSAQEGPRQLSLDDWQQAIATELSARDDMSRRLFNLALALSFLRERGRRKLSVSGHDLSRCWALVRGALTDNGPAGDLFAVSRNSQGFLTVPLCSLSSSQGDIDELFRLHVWLPDQRRGNPDFALHSHQCFGQSWILAGEGEDFVYDVQEAESPAEATHAEYALAWSDGKSLDSTYKVHSASSVVKRTGRLVKATATQSTVYTRDSSYTIAANVTHRSQVRPRAFHATLFFFDSRRGFVRGAAVLGPKDLDAVTHHRTEPDSTPRMLARQVDDARTWELLMEQGRSHARRTDWEHALREFDRALSLCQSSQSLPNTAHFRHLTLGELGSTNRRFGRYGTAKDILEKVIAEMDPSAHQVEFQGELGVSYRHMNRLEDAKAAFESQYRTAERLGLEWQMCRAIGNLGMVNFQLSQQHRDERLLDTAIRQLEQRVETARSLRAQTERQQGQGTALESPLKTWEVIGLGRLSLCHYARGNAEEAISTSLAALEITRDSPDATVRAMTRFFYGRALLLQGRRMEALSLFNVPGTCSPAIALAKEPSEEHRAYLKELVDIGADMNIVDQEGYTALDHAVFNGDSDTEALVLDGLRKNAAQKIELQLTDSRLRKQYRELFQEHMRPVLLGGGPDCLQQLRRAYAQALASDESKRQVFDSLKFVPWRHFAALGRLPGRVDGIVVEWQPPRDTEPCERSADFLIFISYRWMKKATDATSPDDEQHSQYLRMRRAVEELLRLHPSIDERRVGIWADYACIDQADPSTGVGALPLIVAQCNAIVSLVDDEYYDRAWCLVEVLMAQTLRRSYGLHLWYEQVDRPGESGELLSGWGLREGKGREVSIENKGVTYEEDRPKVMFLERQSRLLG
ncbi:hypothetical protein CDD83_128 [Cordyceps sp. RAO-2017]|nr:hypothetical protein CDD83_128 [Cordyceps sp. RAO-2017]